jgi:hypothetical protein
MKATYQVVIFHCTLSVANDLQMQQGSSKTKGHLTKNYSHMTSKSGDYFKRLLESQNSFC